MITKFIIAAAAAWNDIRQRRSHPPQPWPNCNITYTIATQQNCAQYGVCAHPVTNQNTKQAIKNAALEISQKIPLCTFTETQQVTPQNGVLVIAKPETCYVNHVGYIPNYINIMSLGWCAQNEPVIKHELLHIIGVNHEHQNTLAQPYIETCYTTEEESCTPNNANCKPIDHHRKTYDPLSIMHYPVEKQAACNIKLTSKGKRLTRSLQIAQTDIGNLKNISDIDAQYIATLYNTHTTLTHHNHKNTSPNAIANTLIAAAPALVTGIAIIAA